MKGLSIGMIEVEGYSVALAVIDEMCKAMSIRILAIDCNNPTNESLAQIPMAVQVIFQGHVAEVSEALKIGEWAASKLLSSKAVLVSQLTKGAQGMDRLVTTGKVIPNYDYAQVELFANTSVFKKPQSLCLIEIQNYSAALGLANELLTNFELKYEHHEPNLGGRLLTLIFSGSESQVLAVTQYVKASQLFKNKQILMCLALNKPTEEVMRYALKKRSA